MDSECRLYLVKLYAIEKGWLDYLPCSIPAVRNVKILLDDVFASSQLVEIQGHLCLHKDQLRAGIHRRVLRLMGSLCIVCGRSYSRGMEAHHIKPHWRTWSNAWGFTILCNECHKKIRYGIDKTPDKVQAFCKEITSPSSQLYDPSDGKIYPEASIVKMPRIGYFYIE